MSESPVGPQIEELDRQIATTVNKVVRELQRKLGERVRESSEEILRQLEKELEADVPKSFLSSLDLTSLVEKLAPPKDEAPPEPQPSNPAEDLLAAISRVDAETAQADVLKALVNEACRFASRTAFFLIRSGEVRGYGSAGWEPEVSGFEQLSFRLPDQGAWADLVQGQGAGVLDEGECQDLAGRVGAEAATQGLVIPFSLRGQVAGALYADHTPGGKAPDLASLQLLTHAAAQALETAAYREGGAASVTLRTSANAARAVAAAKEASKPAPAVEPVSAPETDVETAAEAEPEEIVPVETAPAPPEEPEAVEPATSVEPPEEPEGVERAIAVEPLEDAAAETPAMEPVPVPGGSESIWQEDDEDDEPTVIGQRAVSPPEPAPVPPTSVAPVTPPGLEGNIGQQTVRLDVSQLPTGAGGFELEPEPLPAPEMPTQPVEPPTQVQPPADMPPTQVRPPAHMPSTQVRPPAGMPPTQVRPPADMAPTQVRPPADMAPTQVQPPADMAPTRVQPPADMAPTQVQPPADVGHPSSFAAPPTEAPTQPEAPPPASAPAEASSAGGTTEVRPPDDLDGPGLAFAAPSAAPAADTGIPAGEEALHEEARRLARLLVSEIKLYNEEVIEEGRMAGNIYSRLKEDIDRSRQMYNERIDPRIKEDYFFQELVQRLAGGDPKLLGM